MNWEDLPNAARLALIIGLTLTVVGAFVDGWKHKVPNKLTFPTIVAAWLYWLCSTWYLEGTLPAMQMLGMSLLGTIVAGGLVLIPYIVRMVGAGDVKLYAGFGAWIVPVPGFGLKELWWAFAIGVIIGGIHGIIMAICTKTVLVHWEKSKDFLADMAASSSIEEVRRKNAERKASQMLLPYGVPLTIGGVAYICLLLAGFPSF